MLNKLSVYEKFYQHQQSLGEATELHVILKVYLHYIDYSYQHNDVAYNMKTWKSSIG